jgi:hypothetical protein
VADHPLRPANDRSLGGPLPRQQANRTQAPLQATSLPLALGLHAVLAVVSHGCPPPRDRYLRVTHPSATEGCPPVRLACVKHAASVRSEPGSNSQVHHAWFEEPRQTNKPCLSLSGFPGVEHQGSYLTSVTVTHQRYITATPIKHQINQNRAHGQTPSTIKLSAKSHIPLSRAKRARAPPTYPFHRLYNCQRTEGTEGRQPASHGASGLIYPAEHLPVQTDKHSHPVKSLQELLFTRAERDVGRPNRAVKRLSRIFSS